MYDVKNVIENILKQLNLKNEVELAEKLGITKNALSMLKKRKSLGTLIEKELIVSFDQMIYGVEYNLKGLIEVKINSEISNLKKQIDNLKD